MNNESIKVNKGESSEQNRISPSHQGKIRFLIYFTAALMLVIIIIADKSGIKNKDVWVAFTNAICVASMYLLVIYYQYALFPERQKKLKALVDAFANLLALIAIALTFISVVISGKASSLYADLAGSGGTSIIFGVIIGVLSSRVLFPFWDLYSRYRRV